jgi:hypothetical protein
VNRALSGIIRPANPQLGDIFNNEFAAGAAKEFTPLAGTEKDINGYAKKIGVAFDGPTELISY